MFLSKNCAGIKFRFELDWSKGPFGNLDGNSSEASLYLDDSSRSFDAFG